MAQNPMNRRPRQLRLPLAFVDGCMRKPATNRRRTKQLLLPLIYHDNQKKSPA